MNKQCFLLLLVLVSLPMVFGYEQIDSIIIDESQLPFTGNTDNTLTLIENYSIFINQVEFNDYVDLTFPSQIDFNSSTAKLNVSFVVSKFYPENELTSLFSSINLTNDFNSNSYWYGLNITVTKNNTEEFLSKNSTDVFYIFDSGYNFTISEDLLPREESLKFNIIFNEGQTLNVTNCDEWLICPDHIYFPTNTTSFRVNYSIPVNSSVGFYDRTFDVIGENFSRTNHIYFNIVPTDYLVRRYIWDVGCFDSEGNIDVLCWEDYESFQIRRLTEIMKLARNNSIETVINETEVLVMTGSIDAELKSLYDQCVADKITLSEEFSTCTTQVNQLLGEKTDFDQKVKNTEQELEQKRIDQENIQKEEQAQLKKKIKDWVVGVIVTIFILGLMVLYYLYTLRVNGRI